MRKRPLSRTRISDPTTIAGLTPDPHNRRTHNARNIDLIAAALKDVGAARSIVIDESNEVLAGNGVIAGATQAGLSKLQIVDADGDTIIAVRRRGLTVDQKRALAIFDNRAAELAAWNVEQLNADRADGKDLSTFFTDDELADLFRGPGAPSDGLTPADDVPAVRSTKIVVGDHFQLGTHHLICGDATDAAAVTRLANGHAFDLVVTSPPYNVGIKYNQHQDRAQRDEYLALIESTARGFLPHLSAGRFVAWNVGVSPRTFHAHQIVRLVDCGLNFYREIVWKKNGVPYPIFPSTVRTKRARNYHPNYVHEVIEVFETNGPRPVADVPCGLCEGSGRMAARELLSADAHEVVQLLTRGEPVQGGAIAPDHRYRDDVWSISQSQSSAGLKTIGKKSKGLEHGAKDGHVRKEHPAAFPVELPRALLGFLTTEGEHVFDPFGGSGSTIIACEQLRRRGFLVELDPQYCQVIIDRWEAFTGKKAQKVGERVRLRKAKGAR